MRSIVNDFGIANYSSTLLPSLLSMNVANPISTFDACPSVIEGNDEISSRLDLENLPSMCAELTQLQASVEWTISTGCKYFPTAVNNAVKGLIKDALYRAETISTYHKQGHNIWNVPDEARKARAAFSELQMIISALKIIKTDRITDAKDDRNLVFFMTRCLEKQLCSTGTITSPFLANLKVFWWFAHEFVNDCSRPNLNEYVEALSALKIWLEINSNSSVSSEDFNAWKRNDKLAEHAIRGIFSFIKSIYSQENIQQKEKLMIEKINIWRKSVGKKWPTYAGIKSNSQFLTCILSHRVRLAASLPEEYKVARQIADLMRDFARLQEIRPGQHGLLFSLKIQTAGEKLIRLAYDYVEKKFDNEELEIIKSELAVLESLEKVYQSSALWTTKNFREAVDKSCTELPKSESVETSLQVDDYARDNECETNITYLLQTVRKPSQSDQSPADEVGSHFVDGLSRKWADGIVKTALETDQHPWFLLGSLASDMTGKLGFVRYQMREGREILSTDGTCWSSPAIEDLMMSAGKKIIRKLQDGGYTIHYIFKQIHQNITSGAPKDGTDNEINKIAQLSKVWSLIESTGVLEKFNKEDPVFSAARNEMKLIESAIFEYSGERTKELISESNKIIRNLLAILELKYHKRP